MIKALYVYYLMIKTLHYYKLWNIKALRILLNSLSMPHLQVYLYLSLLLLIIFLMVVISLN